MARAAKLWPGLSPRHLRLKCYAYLARAILKDHPGFDFIIDSDMVLAELAKLEDARMMVEMARVICELKATMRTAINMIRSYRMSLRWNARHARFGAAPVLSPMYYFADTRTVLRCTQRGGNFIPYTDTRRTKRMRPRLERIDREAAAIEAALEQASQHAIG